MTDETIVAVYDTPAHAELAAEDLKAAGVPPQAITVHAAGGSIQGDRVSEPPQERGFWSSLFGGEPDHDVDVYQRSLASGSTVVTVQVPEAHASTVLDILNSHRPIDIDERAATYGLTQGYQGTGASRQDGLEGAAATLAGTGVANSGTAKTGATNTNTSNTGVLNTGAVNTAATNASTTRDGAQTLQLSEEQLSVGKRVINRGTTRVRRFVVETPVEQQVSLHDEKITVERRPVTGGPAVSNPDFAEKTVEVQAFGEEAVVGKTARVVEEVAIGKQASERVETVRDTVRREDVEITKADAETAGRTGPVR